MFLATAAWPGLSGIFGATQKRPGKRVPLHFRGGNGFSDKPIRQIERFSTPDKRHLLYSGGTGRTVPPDFLPAQTFFVNENYCSSIPQASSHNPHPSTKRPNPKTHTFPNKHLREYLIFVGKLRTQMILRNSKIFVAILAIVLVFKPEARAQQVVWGASFDFFFDNREYKSEINWPQTLFGARIAPELGIRWQQRHSLMMGVDLLANFGAKPFQTDNEIFGYYQYDGPKFKAWAGVIPRRKTIGDYPSVFFSDSVRYYDPNLTGLLLQYSGGRGYVEFGCDWNSLLSTDRREKFLLFSAGRINQGMFYGGYHLSMYHHAGTITEDGVVDNILLHPHIGADFSKMTGLEKLSLQVGWLQAFQNDRKYVGEYVTPGGAQIELKVQMWKLGIFNTLYAGKNLMPYYIADPSLDYGPGLYWGEPWYRTENNIYDRLEIYWEPIRNDIMKLRVASVHHFDGKKWGWQQKVLFSIDLGQRKMFKNKK